MPELFETFYKDKDLVAKFEDVFDASFEPGLDSKYFAAGDFLIALNKLMDSYDFSDCDDRLWYHLCMAYHFARLDYLKRRKEFLEG